MLHSGPPPVVATTWSSGWDRTGPRLTVLRGWAVAEVQSHAFSTIGAQVGDSRCSVSRPM